MDNLIINVKENKGILGSLKSLFSKKETDYKAIENNNAQDYINAVKAAAQELENVERLFNNTADPDLIEYAIYEQRAVKVRFSYLVKKAKEKNIKCQDLISP